MKFLIIFILLSGISYSQGKIIYMDTTVQVDSLILTQVYPQPFSPVPTEEFFIPEISEVKLDIFNETGEFIKTIYNGTVNKGRYQVLWDFKDSKGNDLKGLFFIKLTALFSTGVSEERYSKRLIIY